MYTNLIEGFFYVSNFLTPLEFFTPRIKEEGEKLEQWEIGQENGGN